MKNLVRKHLEMIAGIQHVVHPGNRYSGYDSLLLDVGIDFPDPTRDTQGTRGECYVNAFNDMLVNPNLVYVEGYALMIIPMLHAWCVDIETGETIDPTWGTDGGQYLGIPFKRKYVIQSATKSGCYGVLDQWEERWPILRDDPEEYVHPNFMPASAEAAT